MPFCKYFKYLFQKMGTLYKYIIKKDTKIKNNTISFSKFTNERNDMLSLKVFK